MGRERRRGSEKSFPTGGCFPVHLCSPVGRAASLSLRRRPFVHRASGRKEGTECSKDGAVVRHGVCPMLSVVAMGMLLIGRRADRRHGSRGATPTIAHRPRPTCPPRTPTAATPCCPSLSQYLTLVRLNVLAHDAIRLHVRRPNRYACT